MLLRDASRIRVERMLAGDPSPHDVDLLLSDLRFIKGAHPLVVEVGDFAAHRELKVKGDVKTVATSLHSTLAGYIESGGAFAPKAAFDADTLAKAFVATLINSGILPKHRLTSLKRFRTPLALYAICAMHGTDVELDNGALARLAVRNDHDGTISVGAFLPLGPPKEVFVNCAIFTTTLPVKDYCEGHLLADLLNPEINSDRGITLERTPQQLLRYLE